MIRIKHHPAEADRFTACFDPGTVVAVASSAFSVAKTVSAGKAQAQQYAFQAAVQRQQAASQRQQAERQRQEAGQQRQFAAAEELRLRRRQEKEFGARRARLSASGVEVSSGTPLLALEELAAEAELDLLFVRAGGETRSNSLLFDASKSLFNASQSEARSTASQRSGSAARTKSLFDAGTTLLSALN